MTENTINHKNITVVINGGDPLAGCPENWEDAKAWELKANEGKGEKREPEWSFDCGFKLDFDGPLLSVSSRFYPPKSHYGQDWDGDVTINLMGNPILAKAFKEKTLDELKIGVENYIKQIVDGLTQSKLFDI